MYKRNEMLEMKRPESGRIHMDRKRRAKQFAPFQALKGFEHSVRDKETIYEMKRLQSDGIRSELDQMISRIGQEEIKVTYYMESEIKPGFGTYLDVYGIAKLRREFRIMEIGGMEIPFDDIAEIQPADSTKI